MYNYVKTGVGFAITRLCPIDFLLMVCYNGGVIGRLPEKDTELSVPYEFNGLTFDLPLTSFF
jgi:hypothetical protein